VAPDVTGRAARRGRDEALGAVGDVGAVLFTWAAGLALELAAVGAPPDGRLAEVGAASVALAVLVPGAIVAVAMGRLAYAAGDDAALGARDAFGAAVAACFGAVAVGVSGGRHFTSVSLRVLFVAGLAGAALGLARVAAPLARRILDGPRGKAAALLVGCAGAFLFWRMDQRVLVRLYPAFHGLLLALALASAALTVRAWRSRSPAPTRRGEGVVLAVGLALGCAALACSTVAARRLADADDVRLALDERAPLLGRAVRVAAWIAPPVAIAPRSAPPAAGEIARSLDWTHADVVLVSVDALRADHLGAYGYPRRTTPSLDALARESALFEHAYCPTPSTSYSVSSMMTGKAMRPLLSLGLGRDSETWAALLRARGYETAAFYPPAIFYIDADRFTELERAGLGFEHRATSFASAEERVAEVDAYLEAAGPAPLFLWVHLYEPHEPYAKHAGYEFGDGDRPVDAYDSEIAYTDAAVGALLRAVRARREGHALAVIATADHGEEFGEHGGRYHGTTCYEEQVRVPLLVSGPGVTPRRVSTVVQTIDLLPTVLSAVGAPRPARARGRDLGALLAGEGAARDPGLAFAETDDRTLLARGDDRLICARKIAACALYDIAKDPEERVDRAAREPDLTHELRALTVGIERDLGRDEPSGAAWPDALRRGMQGETDAAEEVARLLDDPNVLVRRKAAEVCFRLAVAGVTPRVQNALANDPDDEVKRWASLALVRTGARPSATADALARDVDPAWRRAAALAFAVRGDARGKLDLEAWWQAEGPSRSRGVRIHTPEAAELLRALSTIKDHDAVPSLVESLGYYPMRPRIAEALGVIGDPRAKAPLLASLARETYEPARAPEARALVALGAAREALGPLTLFAGLPDPMTDAVVIALDAGVLDARSSAATMSPPTPVVDVRIATPEGASSARLWALASSDGGALQGSVDDAPLGPVTTAGPVHRVELRTAGKHDVRVQVRESTGLRALWIVPSRAELADGPRSPSREEK
jgi:hypothetical protein